MHSSRMRGWQSFLPVLSFVGAYKGSGSYRRSPMELQGGIIPWMPWLWPGWLPITPAFMWWWWGGT